MRRAAWAALAVFACGSQAPQPVPAVAPAAEADDAWTADLARKRSDADHETMRARFREARGAEKNDPARAIALYQESWKTEPTIAAALGLARAAHAKHDDPLAARWLDRARRVAERQSGHDARLDPAPSSHERVHRLLALDDEVATFLEGQRTIAEERLADGALSVVASLPDGVVVRAASRHFAIAQYAGTGDAPPRLLELGVDEWSTARDVPALAKAAQWAISPDEKVLVGWEWGGPIDVVDRATGTQIAAVAAHGGEGLVGFLGDGSLAVDRGEGPCTIAPPAWNACAPIAGLPPIVGATLSAAAGRFLAVRTTGAFYLFDVVARAVTAKLEGHFQTVTRLAVAPDGRSLVSLSSTRAVLWDVARQRRVSSVAMGSEDTPAYTPNGARLVAGGWTSTNVVDATPPDFALVSQQTFFEGKSHVAFGASGALWIAGEHGVARIGRDGSFRAYPTAGAYSLALSSDERWFAITAFGYAQVHDAETGEAVPQIDDERRRLALATSAVAPDSIASPDGMTVVTAQPHGEVAVATDLHDPTTIECGPAACVVTDADGGETILGDASSVQCKVGAVWLPAEACDGAE